MPLDGSAPPRAIVRNDGDDLQPVFAPDGRWLAYSSDVSGTMEVYVEAFPGSGQRVHLSFQGEQAILHHLAHLEEMAQRG